MASQVISALAKVNGKIPVDELRQQLLIAAQEITELQDALQQIQEEKYMNTKTFVRTDSSSEVISTANAVHTVDLPTHNDDGAVTYMYVELYSDVAGTTPVAATAGTIEVKGSPLGNVFLAPPANGTLQATNINSGDYTPPAFFGLIAKARVTFAGITGAPYARVAFGRSK